MMASSGGGPPILFIAVVSALILMLGFFLVIFPATAQKVFLKIGVWWWPGVRNPFLAMMANKGYQWYIRSVGVVLIFLGLFTEYAIVVGER